MNRNHRMSSRLVGLLAIVTAVATLPVGANAASLEIEAQDLGVEITRDATSLREFIEAQDLGVEITRDATSLREFISTRPVDIDRVNTALVFTNVDRRKIRVGCVAYNQSGRPIDRGWVAVAPNGMRFILASEVAGGRDFVGNVQCKSGGRVIGSAILLAPGLTDLPVEQHSHHGATHLRFPVIAAY